MIDLLALRLGAADEFNDHFTCYWIFDLAVLSSVLLLTAWGYPIERIGESCPLGYYRSGDYCVPSGSAPRRYRSYPAGPESQCFLGWFRVGGYCVKSSGTVY